MTDDEVRAVRMAAILAAAILDAGRDPNTAEYVINIAKQFADYIIHGVPA